MDLRKYSPSRIEEEVLLSLWWYQPYIFSDNIVSGEAPTWFMRGFNKTIIRRSDYPLYFDGFRNLSMREARMYDDWFNNLCRISGIDLRKSSVFELACNTGYFLLLAKMLGAKDCVGIDKADLHLQRSVLSEITGISDIDFRDGRWSSEMHRIDGLLPHESFDLVVVTAFAQHISDPLHLIRELSLRTRKALLIHTQVRQSLGIPDFAHRVVADFLNLIRGRRRTSDMKITYLVAEHHNQWGNVFPNNFDTIVSKALLLHGLKECGFRQVHEVPWSRGWLPYWWYRQYVTLICLK